MDRPPIELIDIEVCGKTYAVQVSTELNRRDRAAAIKAHARDIKQHIDCNKA